MLALNAALLREYYGVAGWSLPAGFLCPSVPGRADYLHCLADLLADGGEPPRGLSVRVLDIGVGANCVYPLIGHSAYGWRFLGSEIDPQALASAARILESNPQLKGAIEVRLQPAPGKMLAGLLKPGERFHASICNPPFHASAREAEQAARRKWKNLGKAGDARKRPALNFGGRGRELWCPGGESAFVCALIRESAQEPARCGWFTTLLSKSANLPAVQRALRQARVAESRTIEMTQGQKKSRLVAWSFLAPGARLR